MYAVEDKKSWRRSLFTRSSLGRGIVAQEKEAGGQGRKSVLQLASLAIGGRRAVGADTRGGLMRTSLGGREDEELGGGGVGVHFDSVKEVEIEIE